MLKVFSEAFCAFVCGTYRYFFCFAPWGLKYSTHTRAWVCELLILPQNNPHPSGDLGSNIKLFPGLMCGCFESIYQLAHEVNVEAASCFTLLLFLLSEFHSKTRSSGKVSL